MRDGRPDRWALRTATALLAAAALALALASCGGGSPAATAQGTTRSTASPTTSGQTTPPSKSKAELAQQRPRAADAGSLCQAQLGEFLGAMDKLRRNLVVGLSYEQYVGEVKAVRGAYDRVPTGRVALGCLNAAGTAAESALNQYIAANNAWTECVETSGCNAAAVEGQLQAEWREASEELSKAQGGLRGLGGA